MRPSTRAVVAPDDLRALAVEAATGAGELLQRFAWDLAEGADLDVDHKASTTDPVSAADAAAERAIVETLLTALPDDGILGEEDQVPREGSTGRTWVIDPLDGTVNFLYGWPLWCVSVACVDADGTVAGAIVHPPSGEVFHGARGEGAWLGERALRVREVDDPAHGLVCTGFAYDRAVRTDWGREAVGLLSRFRDLRRGGAAALDLAWVAAGRADAYVEFALQPWDWAVGRLLVIEAGGVVTELHRELGGARQPGLVAGGRRMHDALLEHLGHRP
ncbi:MAG: inositol monophosphatase [Nitriliruptor sp.]|nr:MAG: inositol monophosphatase [Nitriliruptor sp.]